MELFKRLKAMFARQPAPSPVDASTLRPALRYHNRRSPDGPHVAFFDGFREDEKRGKVLVLDLRGDADVSQRGQMLLACLDALEQNADFACSVLMDRVIVDEMVAVVDTNVDDLRSAVRRLEFEYA